MKKKIVWALLISFLALGLRLNLAYTGPIEFDETVYASVANQYNLAMRGGNWGQILNSTDSTEHPQFYKLVYSFGLFAGTPIVDQFHLQFGTSLQSYGFWKHLLVLRIISAVFGTAAVFLLSLINPAAGLFLAIDTYAVKYTSVIYLEALPALTSLVAMIAALKSLKGYQKKPADWKKWSGWLVLSALALGMSAASKYMYGVVGIAIVIAIVIESWKQKLPALLGLATWGALSLVFFFALDPVLWHSTLDRLNASLQFNINYSTGQHVNAMDYPIWQPIKWLMLSIPQQPNSPTAFFISKGNYLVPADSLIFILALVGLPFLYRKNRPMAIWLVVGLAFLLFWNTKWPQYILLILAPFCLSAGYGLDFILHKFIRSKPAPGLYFFSK